MTDDNQVPSKETLLQQMDESLTMLLTALDELTEEQMLMETDASGWNVRDHMTHIAAWAEGVAAMLRCEDRWAAMGIVEPKFKDDRLDVDPMNAEIRRKYQDVSPADARTMIVTAHSHVARALEDLPAEDLSLPFMRFVEPFTEDWGDPIYVFIQVDASDHYLEHIPWINAIVDESSDQ